jgi:2Fe-2S ferredoxin
VSDGGTVRVEPTGVVITVGPDETLMAAANRSGWWWPTICKGNAQCNRCFVDVIDGADCVEPMGAVELEGLRRVRWHGGAEKAGERLACQLRVSGPVRVRKVGVREMDDGGRDG